MPAWYIFLFRVQAMANLLSNPSPPHELLICGVCNEVYDDNLHRAKFLACHHTFCSQCLMKLANRGQVNTTIECPSCRANTCVPENGIDGLQTNFYISSFQEISGNIQPPRAMANLRSCPWHNSQPISYLCVTCGTPICRDCISVDHSAKTGHSVISISEEHRNYLEELNASHELLAQNKRNLQIIEEEMLLFNATKETAIKDMEVFIKLAYEKHRKNLMQHIVNQCNIQQNALLGRQKQIQDSIDELNKNINQTKKIKKTGYTYNLECITKGLKAVNVRTKTTSSNLQLGENHLKFDSTKGLREFNKCLSNLGQIYTQGYLPSMIAFRETESKIGHIATLTVEVYNHQGDKLTVPSDSFSVQVTGPGNGKVPVALRMDGSDYTVTFLPLTSGLHEVSGMFQGQKLLGEQTHISVSSNNPVLTVGMRGNGRGTFQYPWSITMDNNNCLYVTDVVNRLIQKFTADGKFLNQFSVAVHNKDHSTSSIALDLNEGLIYCPEIALTGGGALDTGSNMLVFNLEGELQHTYPLSGAKSPFFIAMNSYGELIISDISKKFLSKVDKEGKFLCSTGDFKEPGYIAIDDKDNIIVSDTSNHCICIFEPNGKLKHRFGTHGHRAGELHRPFGVATDGENILLTQENKNYIQVFRYDGTFVSIIMDGNDLLKDPRGLAVTKDGHVYVVDRHYHCIRKYKYKNAVW